MAIIEIRPRTVFENLESKFPGENVEFHSFIPTSKIGSLLLLEGSILVSLLKILDAKIVFEFGTFMGGTSATLAMNSNRETRIFTLDLDKENFELSDEKMENFDLKDANENDEFLRKTFAESGAVYIERLKSTDKSKIEQIFCNSYDFDANKYNLNNKVDLIFVDGGHDIETIQNDTKKALEMASSDAVIVWHDFNSKIHGDVTRFINEYSKNNNIVHVQNTMFAIQGLGKYEGLFSEGAL